MSLTVTKRNGSREPIDVDKIHRVITWASEGLEDVSASDIEMKAHIQFYDGIPTEDIHELIIKSAADLISEETPDYQYLAARLAIFHLRKKAYKRFTPPSLFEQVSRLVRMGKYDPELLTDYSEAEFAEMDQFIDHWRDLNFAYAAVKQWEGKYLLQNRVTREIYESPQFAFLLIGACLFARYPKETRLIYVRRFYDACSLFKISLPTPIMSGVRTPTRQFSSCVLIEADDSLDAINATASAIVKYVSQRAGIGVNIGRIRALGSPIRNGEALHTGLIPFIKYFQTAVKSCSQGGVRGGAATLFYPLWHLEVETLLVLKNNRGTEENRVRNLDYGVQINRLMYDRLTQGGKITLFSPSDVPGLYDAFFADQAEFERLYLRYEQDTTIRHKKVVEAKDLFTSLMQERAQTGRIYIQNVDHCNTHSAFNPAVAPIKQSNLCMEITLPTKPLQNIDDPNGEIALCTLAAFNLGSFEQLDELESLADLLVRALDSLLDYQNYPVNAALHNRQRRTLGVGVTNFAYYLAKHGVYYSNGSANRLTHRLFEAFQYYLLKASNQLAKELGKCNLFEETKYAQGILPIDTYKREVDKVCPEPLHYDWEALRADIQRYGLRNSTLSALMPCETSSQITNSTNGIEPPRGLMSVKSSKDGTPKQIVPGFTQYGGNYELLWSIPDNKGYLELVGIMQKFVDQSISANTNYDPARYPNKKVPVTRLLQDLLYAHAMGVKTLYYHQTRDGSGQQDEDDCAGGACKL